MPDSQEWKVFVHETAERRCESCGNPLPKGNAGCFVCEEFGPPVSRIDAVILEYQAKLEATEAGHREWVGMLDLQDEWHKEQVGWIKDRHREELQAMVAERRRLIAVLIGSQLVQGALFLGILLL